MLETFDALIVGGGIGGAVLALELGRVGKRVGILERSLSAPPLVRPEVLADATFTTFDRLGAGERIRERHAVSLTGFQIHRGRGPLVEITSADLAAAGVVPRSVEPSAVRGALLDAAVATGSVTLLRGAEAREIAWTDGRVAGVRGFMQDEPFDLRATLVVGDDGARSMVRKALGIEVPLEPFPVEFFTAVLPRAPGLPSTIAQVWLRPGPPTGGPLTTAFLPIPGERSMLVMGARVPAGDALVARPDDWRRQVAATTPLSEWIESHVPFPDGFQRHRLSFGHARRYSVAGAVLIGDAAHPMSPAGGQGANAAVADAAALARALAMGSPGSDGGNELDAALARYESRRRPANDRSLSFSRRGAFAIRVLDRLPGSWRLLPLVLGAVGAFPALRRSALRASGSAFLDDES